MHSLGVFPALDPLWQGGHTRANPFVKWNRQAAGERRVGNRSQLLRIALRCSSATRATYYCKAVNTIRAAELEAGPGSNHVEYVSKYLEQQLKANLCFSSSGFPGDLDTFTRNIQDET